MTMIRIQKRLYKSILLFLMAIILLVSIPGFAFAAEEMDGDKPLTLSVSLAGDELVVPGIQFKAYRIAAMDERINFTVNPKYAEYNIDFSLIADQNNWSTLSQTLQNYIIRDGIEADYTASSNEFGWANFGEIERGLYLILAEPFTFDDVRYRVVANMIAAPSVDELTDEWVYDLAIGSNYKSESEPAGMLNTSGLQVIKKWVNDESLSRPEKIDVQLICDGEIIDTVELNQSNEWKHSWDSIEANKTYAVTEKDVPEGYSVSVSSEDDIYTITNSGMTSSASTSSGTQTTTPPTTAAPPSKPPTLPRTGVPWVPAAILGVSGLILFLAGAVKKASEK